MKYLRNVIYEIVDKAKRAYIPARTAAFKMKMCLIEIRHNKIPLDLYY